MAGGRERALARERRGAASVLIADDMPRMRLLLRRTLEAGSYDVLEASDGDQAIAVLAAYRPALAILDMAMPGRTGLEVCRAIRANPALARMRVLIVTSSGSEDDALAAGADAYLAKPFSPIRLLEVVATLVGHDNEGPAPVPRREHAARA